MQKVQLPKIYFDTASTTPIHPEILGGYCRLLETEFYNSDALYDGATKLAKMMEKSRESIADLLDVYPEEIIFTSGATEANNLAIKGIAFQYPEKKHLITTQIEHSSVLNVFKRLENDFGYDVTYLPVNSDGVVSLEDLQNAIRKDTLLISIMMVNNEVGSIQPVLEMKQWIKMNTQAFFHVDAVQALGKIPVDCKDIDLISFSAHKIEGLKGSGILVKKKHVQLVPLIEGGQQEMGLRGGTSNTLVNLFFAKTMRLALENQKKYHAHLNSLNEQLIQGLSEIEGLVINTPPKKSVVNIVNFSTLKISSEVMMNALNQRGIQVAAQSTCSSNSNYGSSVLRAMGFAERSTTCIRLSFSYHHQKKDIQYVIDSIKEICNIYGNL